MVRKSKYIYTTKRIFSYLIVLFLIILLIFVNSAFAFHPCNCSKDRTIKLTKPLMEGDDVKSLQKRLFELDYYHGSIDGLYGVLTEKAVKEFQKDFNKEEDGIVDKDVWGILANFNNSIITSRKKKQPTGELSIVINLYSRRLSLLSNGKVYKSYPVTIGKKETPTPVGEWYIKNKYKRIDKGPLGSRWMGLNIPWGVYGIHGTNKPWEIGVAASEGCVRLHNEYVEELFEWVEIKTPVMIIGERPKVVINKVLKSGNMGYDVMELQERLRERGYYQGDLNGTYDNETTSSVKKLEAQYGLKVDGIADGNIFNILGLEYDL